MKIHWLIKYYFVAFVGIFSIFYLLGTSEPKINWVLYEKDLEKNLKSAISNNDCIVLVKEYKLELKKNYKESFFGLQLRKDRKLLKGLNLLNYLNYHLKEFNCNKK